MKPNASTVSAEQERLHHQKTQRAVHRSTQQRFGSIIEVHETLPLIKAIFDNGQGVAGNQWIPVAHSVLEIIHRFGALRPGLKVLITFSGEAERSAIATVIGVEDEHLGKEKVQDNDAKTGLYEIFTPGGFPI